jgi:hypothetical protein
MLRRRRFKNTTLEELLDAAQRSRERGPGHPDRLIRKTRRTRTASHLREWLITSGLQSPK